MKPSTVDSPRSTEEDYSLTTKNFNEDDRK